KDCRRPIAVEIDPLEQTEERRRRIADDHNRAVELLAPEIDGRRAAGIADAPGGLNGLGILGTGDDLIGGGKMATNDSPRGHRRIAEQRPPAGECRPARLDDVRAEDEIAEDIRHAAGMDEPHRHAGDIGRQAIDRRFAPDRLEGEAVDLLGIAQIGEHRRLLLQIIRIALARPMPMACMGMGRMMMAVFPWAMAVTVIMVVPMVVCVPMLMTVPMIVGVAIMVMIAMAIGMIVVVRVAVGPDAFDVMVVALLGKP